MKKQIKQPSFWAPIKVKNNFFNKPIKTPKLFGLQSTSKSKNFFGVKSFTPVNLSVYPKRTTSEMRLIDRKPFEDRDKDRVPNYFDCRPSKNALQGKISPIKAEEAQKRLKERIKNQGTSKHDTSVYGLIRSVMDERKVNKFKQQEKEEKNKQDIAYKKYREEEDKQERIEKLGKNIAKSQEIYDERQKEKQKLANRLTEAKERIEKIKELKEEKEPKYKEPKEEKSIDEYDAQDLIDEA